MTRIRKVNFDNSHENSVRSLLDIATVMMIMRSLPKMTAKAMLLFVCCLQQLNASPAIEAGDAALRHDIQLLADRGILTGPVTTWPLSWGPVLADLRLYEPTGNESKGVLDSIARLKVRADWETAVNRLTWSARASVAENPIGIRGYQNTPREPGEIGAGVSWTGERLSVTLKGQLVDSTDDDANGRVDGSFLGIAVGNWVISANTLDRWWGPGMDGGLILSNNARPIPGLSLDRNFTPAFELPLLHWLGPWDLNMLFGKMESSREIPNTQFFGLRLNFRPLPSLEVGFSRTAQWCGDGRPCDAGTFFDLLVGKDNLGDGGIDRANEPGNQLAGVDLRWAPLIAGRRVAFYGQFIGEDEAGGLPSRFIGQIGIETGGYSEHLGSWRWFGEFAGTSCRFYESDAIFNCGYNHGIYRTGYRYRGRSIGHGADNDAELYSTGLQLISANDTHWGVLIRSGDLNRGGSPDISHTLTPTPLDIVSIDFSYGRLFKFGTVEIGVGYQELAEHPGGDVSDSRFYMQWRSGY
ncbi:capsule assembly Wzi family protein [Woeseia oceani]|uniref:Capsule assembly Wzi family protein n=1 Tax=Woeseia oceani TaxID=1548547 RepID=A0A193LEG5_9GAMM|nr:capsule assembly Wzi family protein [Woeseia oceani]ANO50920.1 hypothetical protein BA177_06620 [Woeseia oceani]